jgi:hypothetical protein
MYELRGPEGKCGYGSVPRKPSFNIKLPTTQVHTAEVYLACIHCNVFPRYNRQNRDKCSSNSINNLLMKNTGFWDIAGCIPLKVN